MSGPADSLLGEVMQLGVGVNERGHSGGHGALQVFIPPECGELEAFHIRQRLDFDDLPVLDHAGLDIVFAQDVFDGPGGHVAQGVPAGRIRIWDPAHACHGGLDLVKQPNAVLGSQVAQTGGKAHPIQDQHIIFHSALVQAVTVLADAHAGWDNQAFDLIFIRAAVVFLQDVHQVHMDFDGGFHDQVAETTVWQYHDAGVIFFHDSLKLGAVFDVDDVDIELVRIRHHGFQRTLLGVQQTHFG